VSLKYLKSLSNFVYENDTLVCFPLKKTNIIVILKSITFVYIREVFYFPAFFIKSSPFLRLNFMIFIILKVLDLCLHIFLFYVSLRICPRFKILLTPEFHKKKK